MSGMERVTRLVYIFISVGNENSGVDPIQLGSSKSPPETCIEFFEPSSQNKNKTDAKASVLFLWSG